MLWSLLKGHGDGKPPIAKFHCAIANQQVGKVLDGDLAFEGDATTARGVRAHLCGSLTYLTKCHPANLTSAESWKKTCWQADRSRRQ